MTSIDQPLPGVLSETEWHRAFALRYQAEFHLAYLGDSRVVLFTRGDWEPIFIGHGTKLPDFLETYEPRKRQTPLASKPVADLDVDDLLSGLL